jgi:hypothetical protein
MVYMTPTWTLHFNRLPLSPNDHVHWRTRDKWNKHWKNLAGIKSRQESVPTMERVRLSAVIYRRNLGVADEDNDRARLKPVVDGLVAVGVIANDTRGQVEWGPVTEERGKPGVKLIIEQVELRGCGSDA